MVQMRLVSKVDKDRLWKDTSSSLGTTNEEFVASSLARCIRTATYPKLHTFIRYDALANLVVSQRVSGRRSPANHPLKVLSERLQCGKECYWQGDCKESISGGSLDKFIRFMEENSL